MAVPPPKRRFGNRALGLVVLVTFGAVIAGAVGLRMHWSDNPGCETSQRSDSCARVLFLGNSYTSVNDLPTMFASLAWSGGHRVETGSQAPGGWALSDHARAQDTESLLASKPWDLVVLQEQSQIPSLESSRESDMYPAARHLISLIREAGAAPIFFVTWAHRSGWPQEGLLDYAAMQIAIDSGYETIANQEQASLAPVGYAWMALAARETSIALWQEDGSHPTTGGTYLAACVFYAAIFDQSPVNLGYRADLSSGAATQIQEVAAATVFDSQSEWRLPLKTTPTASFSSASA